MSAGGLSYHGVLGHTAKATLPSVESWGTNMNILRDPPKSIQTRRIDKVGSTSEITQMIDESGSRINDTIQVYARGVNPMVSVSYGNNNSGNSSTAGSSGGQAYLPYRIARHGAFRPPIRDPRSLLPLSRLPRLATSAKTNASSSLFQEQTRCGAVSDQLKQIKKNQQMIRAQGNSTASRSIYRRIQNDDINKGLNAKILQAKAHTNKNQKKHVIHEGYHPNHQIHESLRTSNVHTQKVHNGHQMTPIEDIFETGNAIKDHLQVSHESNKQGPYRKQEYIHDNIDLERNVPHYNFESNKQGHNYRQSNNNTAHEKYIRPTINPGGFDQRAYIPKINRDSELHGMYSPDQRKTQMSNSVYEMQQARMNNPSPYAPPPKVSYQMDGM